MASGVATLPEGGVRLEPIVGHPPRLLVADGVAAVPARHDAEVVPVARTLGMLVSNHGDGLAHQAHAWQQPTGCGLGSHGPMSTLPPVSSSERSTSMRTFRVIHDTVSVSI